MKFKKKLSICIGACLLILLVHSQAQAFKIPPKPDGYVTDRVSLLTSEQKNHLTQILAQFEQQTSNQVVVALFPSLEGDNLEDFSIRLAEAWKVGQKEKNNGVILLVVPEDKKVRLEVGYGLEPVLTDAASSVIIQNLMIPYFKEGQFYAGIVSGVQGVIQTIQGEFQPSSQPPRRNNNDVQFIALRSLFFVLLQGLFGFFVIDLVRYKRYSKTHHAQKRYGLWEWLLRFALSFMIVNVLLKIFLYSAMYSRGGSYGSRSGFGGGFSSGGGSFGGGGSSGSW